MSTNGVMESTIARVVVGAAIGETCGEGPIGRLGVVKRRDAIVDKFAGFDKALMDAEDAKLGERGADETIPRTFDLRKG
jgi:hypothetical protein